MLFLAPNQNLVQKLALANNKVPVKTIHDWLLECWQSLRLPEHLLSEFQEWQIWQTILRDSSIGRELINLPNTAKLVQDAWHLYHDWNLPLLEQTLELSEEVCAFIEWGKTFKQICQKKHFLSSSEIIPLLLAHREQITWPKEIHLVNFDSLNPQTKNFMAQLPSTVTYTFTTETGIAECQAYPDAEAELYAMAYWAKNQLKQNPTQHIQCAIPKLHLLQQQIQRVFNEIVAEPYSIMSATPLSKVPLIKSTLLILNLQPHRNEIDHISSLFLNPFLNGYADEINTRALLDLELRELNLPQVSWEQILSLKNIQQSVLLNQINNFLALRQQWHDAQTPAQWAEHFKQLCACFGYSESWEKLLEQLHQCTVFSDTLSYSQALNLLQQLADNVLVKSETKNATLQILDLREAATVPCDARWVYGLHSEVWPEPVQANPFLPYALQVQHKLPHSNIENEYAYAQKIIERLTQTAKQVIFSYPTQENDRQLLKSPLLRDFALSFRKLRSNYPESIQKKSWIPDKACGLSGMTAEKYISGGSNILQSQSNCAFQAFGRYRLKAKPVPTPSEYLSPAERGTLLHKALENIWVSLQNQANLLAYDPERIQSIVKHGVQKAMRTYAHVLQKLPKHWQQLEEQCLMKLLSQWLTLEKTRPPFKVLACEQKQSFQLADLLLNLKTDRVDQLHNGERVVIDYKTGSTPISPTHWEGDRPKQVQLPLYAVANPTLRGSIIAHIHGSKAKWSGITAQDSEIPGVTTAEWETTLATWTRTLTTLATQFVQGVATVDPRDPDVCTRCELSSLCRIREHAHEQ
jgi:probable DNA repair protein